MAADIPKPDDSDYDQPISRVLGASKRTRARLDLTAEEVEEDPESPTKPPLKKSLVECKGKEKMLANQLAVEEKKKRELQKNLKEAKAIGMTLKEYRKQKHDTKVVYQQLEIENKSKLAARQMAISEARGTRLSHVKSQETALKTLAALAEKEKEMKEASKKRALEAALKRFKNVANRRSHKAKIIKVMVQKKRNGPWMMRISRADLMGDEDVNVDSMWKIGYSEWMKIRDILTSRKSEPDIYVVRRIDKLVERVKEIGLLPPRVETTKILQPIGPVVQRKRSQRPKEADIVRSLIEQGDEPSADPILNLRLPIGVDPIEGEFITKLEMGMFFKDPLLQKMCF